MVWEDFLDDGKFNFIVGRMGSCWKILVLMLEILIS